MKRLFFALPALAAMACGFASACSAPGERAEGDLTAFRRASLYDALPARSGAAPSASTAPSAVASADALPGGAESDAEVAEALVRVAKARELPIKHVVHGRRLGRDELLVQLKKKMYEEVPASVVHLQGEQYRALELVPIDYDFENGLLKLLQSQIAGYYDPDDKTMYLLDDLGDSLRDITLNHELVHALQDQSFDLEPKLKYHPGKGDEEAALQTLVEGDATSGMMDAAGSSALAVDDDTIGSLFSISTDLSSVGLDTPGFIRDSLVSPYVDGFKFVNALRRRGGWKAVNDAFAHPPTTTEQVLHIDRYLAHKAALVVPDPTIDALGAGFTVGYADTMGEIGFRLMFRDKGPEKMADQAADGWGGDRYVVAEKDAAADDRSFALGMRVKMDSAKDTKEFSEMLSYAYVKPTSGPVACRDRSDLGPFAWQSKGLETVIVSGPYRTQGGTTKSASTCADASKWVAEIFADKAAAGSPKP